MKSNSPSLKIKSALRKRFPGTKFNVVTGELKIFVSWDMDIGSPVTISAVEEITNEFHKTHEIIQIGSPYSSRYCGDKIFYRVDLSPQYSVERKEWAIECLKVLEFEDTFDRVIGYQHFVGNGVYCNLETIDPRLIKALVIGSDSK